MLTRARFLEGLCLWHAYQRGILNDLLPIHPIRTGTFRLGSHAHPDMFISNISGLICWYTLSSDVGDILVRFCAKGATSPGLNLLDFSPSYLSFQK